MSQNSDEQSSLQQNRQNVPQNGQSEENIINTLVDENHHRVMNELDDKMQLVRDSLLLNAANRRERLVRQNAVDEPEEMKEMDQSGDEQLTGETSIRANYRMVMIELKKSFRAHQMPSD